jgi:hypothetical protein
MMDGGAASIDHAPRTMARFFAVLLALAPPVLPRSALADAPPESAVRIHLRGVARIDAHVARSQGKLVVSGTVSGGLPGDLDGAARLGSSTRVAIELARTGPSGAGVPSPSPSASPSPSPSAQVGSLVDLAASAPEMCTDVNQAPVLEGAARMLVPTSALSSGAARFCIRLAVPQGRYLVRLESRAVGLIDGAHLDLSVDLGLQTVSLRFDPPLGPAHALPLDETTPLSVSVVASTEDDGVTHPAAGLALALTNEAGSPLGNATTDLAGVARFIVPSSRLGPAGQGELRVAFTGDAANGATSASATVERHLPVALAFPAASNGKLPGASASTGSVLHVIASGACAARGCIGIPTGTIEAHIVNAGADVIAGAGPLHDGAADVVMTFGSAFGHGGQAELRVLYVPDAPWFTPTDAPALVQPIDPPSAWREFGFAGAGLLVVAWLVASRLSLTSAVRAPRFRPSEDARQVPAVAVVGPASLPGECRGRVLDVHDGSPVARARVAHERPGFERSEVVSETLGGDDGTFTLEARDVRAGDVLVAEGPHHGSLRMPMPSGGELRVTLIARRRALLERLVTWARRRGVPFDVAPEPTPEHVRRMALADPSPAGFPGAARAGADANVDNVRIRAWAGAVEQAAYGGEAIDARREAEVDALAPPELGGGRGMGPRAR